MAKKVKILDIKPDATSTVPESIKERVEPFIKEIEKELLTRRNKLHLNELYGRYVKNGYLAPYEFNCMVNLMFRDTDKFLFTQRTNRKYPLIVIRHKEKYKFADQ